MLKNTFKITDNPGISSKLCVYIFNNMVNSPMEEDKKGPGRPWIGEHPRQRYNIMFDPEVKQKAEAAAKRKGISFSLWLERAAITLLSEEQSDGSE